MSDTQASFSLFNGDINQFQNHIFRDRNLRRTRDLLLPKLISGEVDIESSSVDEREAV